MNAEHLFYTSFRSQLLLACKHDVVVMHTDALNTLVKITIPSPFSQLQNFHMSYIV